MATPPIGMTLAHVRAAMNRLNPAERRVAEAILENPADIATLSASDLAARCGTSAATVVRACRALDFEGYQHLRLLLVRDEGAAATATPAFHGESSDAGEQLRSWTHDVGAAINASSEALDAQSVERCIQMLVDARRIMLIGSGTSLSVARSAAIHFVMSGIPVESWVDPAMAVMAVERLTASDVCLVISASGQNANSLVVARAAARAGAKVIAVTSYERSSLAQVADHVLLIGRPSGELFRTTIEVSVVQAAVLAGVAQLVAERREPRSGLESLAESLFQTMVSDGE